MRKQSWTKRDPIKNYFPLPNEIYDLKLSRGAIAVYSYLLRREDRKTYQCLLSYREIGESVGMCVTTVRKYVCVTISYRFRCPLISTMSVRWLWLTWHWNSRRQSSAWMRWRERKVQTMLMRILNSLIEHTPVLAAQRTVKTKWYIINRYNESHNDTMDESAVMLFLCDEQRGNLTEEQRTFAKEKKAEVHSSFSLSVFELILYQVMYSLHLVSGPEDFAAVFSKAKSGETSRQIPPCNGL